jgi:dipeptidyl aminopeptidase/acylaminoacyl peptidase
MNFRFNYFKKVMLIATAFVLVSIMGIQLIGQEDLTYQVPPDKIVKLADAKRTPIVAVSPDGNNIILVERPGYPSIKVLSQPELKLAGLRINPATNGPSRSYPFNKITIKNLKTLKEIPITGLPEDPQISTMGWSPDGQNIAFCITRDNGIELWYANLKDGKAVKLTEPILNGAIRGGMYSWLSDGKRIVFKAVPRDRGERPVKDPVPKGPVVQANEGKKSAVRTYQDLLKSKYDEKLFTYYATSQLMVIDLGGNAKPLGKPGLIKSFSLSPDANYVMVQVMKTPFSYLVPYSRFKHSVDILDMNGKLVKRIADIPLADDIAKGFDAVRKGPRSFEWRTDVPATLYWVEAQDGGNPKNKTDVRDKVFFATAPFEGKPKDGPTTKLRFSGFTWGNGKTAMINEFWWRTRKVKTSMFQPDAPEKPVTVLFDRSFEDRYNDPGYFVTKRNKYGRQALLTDKKGNLFLRGSGASPEGNRPFIDRFNVRTKKATRLWRSKAPYYETISAVIDINKMKVLTRRESKKIQPNYYLRNLKSGKLKQVTHFSHPFPLLKDVEKQVIKYKRADGLQLTGDLYLPPGYKKSDGPLPVVMWAYPSEYKSKKAAAQVSGSPHQFVSVNYGSPILWVTQGYAVFDDISMPIIGEGEKEPNDTFIPQLVANARAAIDVLKEMGVGDPKRVAIGGHSYGAFMTANLLSHSRLFAAGIARSGAYNRTLTPFGFQSEERTLWEDTGIYIAMSPFMHAHKVKDPILLIHGQMDNNSGTFPIQSERYYHALKGHGAIARLVMLPFESHGYRARENILHMLWETYTWLEKYVKNKK